MKLKLILVAREGERRDWDEAEGEQIRLLKSRIQSALFDQEVDHLRLLCCGRELEDGKTLKDALHGTKEPVVLHVVAVKTSSTRKQVNTSAQDSQGGGFRCGNLCIIQ